MPGFDRTGPLGQGARTGRGLGPCGGGFAYGPRGGGGRFFRRGRGYGYGYGWGYDPGPYVPADERTWLQQQKEWLEAQLRSISGQIDEMDQTPPNQ